MPTKTQVRSKEQKQAMWDIKKQSKKLCSRPKNLGAEFSGRYMQRVHYKIVRLHRREKTTWNWLLFFVLKVLEGNSLAVQWLGLLAFTAESHVQLLVGELQDPASCVAWPKNKEINKKFKNEKERVKLTLKKSIRDSQ